ncbi:hypothetical protein E2C01_048511 [Portunus trituberculatus]|uniref:Uncharacterized protein n=1 Tax=Portunus trituberculatus TaxID=210409 RepID=A0A5B7GAR4_PORTR|nr:hypothetical protein [Portunus trituberculatus]
MAPFSLASPKRSPQLPRPPERPLCPLCCHQWPLLPGAEWDKMTGVANTIKRDKKTAPAPDSADQEASPGGADPLRDKIFRREIPPRQRRPGLDLYLWLGEDIDLRQPRGPRTSKLA